jgi:hypothetical protein
MSNSPKDDAPQGQSERKEVETQESSILVRGLVIFAGIGIFFMIWWAFFARG